MEFHDHYLRAYQRFFAGAHNFGASHLAVLSIMASEPDRKFSQSDMSYMLGLTEQSINNCCRRLLLLGLIDGERLTDDGCAAMGLDRVAANALPVFDIVAPSNKTQKPLLRMPPANPASVAFGRPID